MHPLFDVAGRRDGVRVGRVLPPPYNLICAYPDGLEGMPHLVSSAFGWGVKQPALCGKDLAGSQAVGTGMIGPSVCPKCAEVAKTEPQ